MGMINIVGNENIQALAVTVPTCCCLLCCVVHVCVHARCWGSALLTLPTLQSAAAAVHCCARYLGNNKLGTYVVR